MRELINLKSQSFRILPILFFLVFSPFACFADENQDLYEKELRSARLSTDLTKCLKHIIKAKEYFDHSKHTVLEEADFNFLIATIITKDLKRLSITEAEKTRVAKEAIPYFEKSKSKYKEFLNANKKSFEEFIEKALNDEKVDYLKSKEFNSFIKNTYAPFVAANMRYFECVAEKANLMQKDDSSRNENLAKTIEEADAFCFLVESPVPAATIGVHVGRILSVLSDCGIDEQEYREKAFERFTEVLATETVSLHGESETIRNIKAKAINGMIELALRTSDYHAALKAIDLYQDAKNPIMPITHKFTLEDFEIMLNAILINAHVIKKLTTEEDRNLYIQNIKVIKMHLEKAIQISVSPDTWKIKLDSYIAKSNTILGEK